MMVATIFKRHQNILVPLLWYPLIWNCRRTARRIALYYVVRRNLFVQFCDFVWYLLCHVQSQFALWLPRLFSLSLSHFCFFSFCSAALSKHTHNAPHTQSLFRSSSQLSHLLSARHSPLFLCSYLSLFPHTQNQRPLTQPTSYFHLFYSRSSLEGPACAVISMIIIVWNWACSTELSSVVFISPSFWNQNRFHWFHYDLFHIRFCSFNIWVHTWASVRHLNGFDPDLKISFSFNQFIFCCFNFEFWGLFVVFETRDIGRQWNNGGKVGLNSLLPLLLPS